MNIKLHQVNLSSSEREYYSKQLQGFEGEFSYPLGSERFHIVHGSGEQYDYFSFFEQMGEVYYFVAIDQLKVVGAGCAILRDGPEGKYWYLCDFKILKEYRGKGILEKMFRKYFFKCVLKSRKLLAVNMGDGSIKSNGLFNKLKHVFWMFRVNVSTLHFYSWNKLKTPNDLKHIYTNDGKKDLVISGSTMPLYHAVKEPLSTNFNGVEKNFISEDAVVMMCVEEKNDIYTDGMSGKGIIISIGLKNPSVSTLEI